MSRRNKLKLERLKLNLRKNVFSMRFPVRNLLVLMVSFAVIFMTVIAVGSLRNAKSGDRKGTDAATLGAAGVLATESAEADSKADSTEEADKAASQISTEAAKIDTAKADKAASINKSAVAVTTVAESKYDMTGKFIVNEDLLNVRREADEDADVLGLLAKGNIGEIVKTEGIWTEVKTDTVSGYVKSEFILTGDAASELAEKFDKHPELLASAGNTDNSDDADTADENDSSEDVSGDDTTEETSEETSDDQSGDYSEDDDQDDYSDDDQDDTEEITEAETEEPTEEPTEEETEEPTEVETTEEVTTEEITTEEVTTEEITTEEVTTEEVTTEEVTTEEVTTEHEPSTDDLSIHGAGGFSADDVRLLAAIVYAESGSEPYEGQVAVANVVLNRLYTGRWGGTLSDVIYAPYQFTATDTWAFSDAYNNGAPETTMSAVYDALNGYNNIGGYLSFRPTWYLDPSSLDDCTVIGNHCFF